MTRVHGTCVAIDGKAVLLRGSSGSGKSDLALRLIDEGAVLVADDQIELQRERNELIASAPPTIVGRMEVRGIGVLPMASVDSVRVAMVVELVTSDRVARLPEPCRCTIEGVELPVVALAPFEAAAAAKVRLALRAVGDTHDSARKTG
jgi:serine kinase of HPr protein (carbohydrate metabolism regulator)